MAFNDNRFGDRHKSFMDGIGAALIASAFGLLLLFGAVRLQYWNEGRAIKDSQSLKSGARQVEVIDPSKFSAANEGKVVFLNGRINTKKELEDQDFNIKLKAVKLLRQACMYQWTEQSSGTSTTGSSRSRDNYTYSKQWSNSLIKSFSFHYNFGHENPDHFRFPPFGHYADDAEMGAFAIAPDVLKELDYDQPFNISPGQDLSKVPAAQKGKLTLEGDSYYVGDNPAQPAVGDEKVSFAYAPSELEYSLVGVQSDHSIKPFMGGGGTRFKMMKVGKVGAEQMFARAVKVNESTTWGYRFLGLLMMFFGFLLLWSPIGAVLNLIPFIGDLAEIGLMTIAIGFSWALSLTVIGFSWLIFRPIIGGCMLAGALVLLICTVAKRSS